MAKFFQPPEEQTPDELAVACHVCLGWELPSHINPFSILEACAWDYWPRFERQLLELWDGPGKPESWHEWQQRTPPAA